MNYKIITIVIFFVLHAGLADTAYVEQSTMPSDGEYVELNGLKFWYKQSGAGPVCLFPTPGWGPDAKLYESSLKPLEKIFTIVYFETRGTGRSQRPAELTQYRYDDFTADLDALRRHLKQEKVWLMGHSCGGLLAMQYALAYPQHCLGLVLLDSVADDNAFQEADLKARIETRKSEPWFAEALKEFTRDLSDIKDDADFQASMISCMPLYFSDASNIKKNEMHFKGTTISLAAAKGTDASNKPLKGLPLNKINVPVLIVVGSDDFICSPLQAERLHLGIAGSKLILIEKAGHFPWLEQPERFFEAIPKGLTALGVEAPKIVPDRGDP